MPIRGSRAAALKVATRRLFALLVALAFAAPVAAQPSTACASARARTEMEAVSAAMWAFYLDLVSAAQAGPGGDFDPVCPDSPPLDVATIQPIHSGFISLFLVPDYIAQVPVYDPWGQPYEYRFDVADPLGPDVMSVRSAGADELFEGTVYEFGATAAPADDLVVYDNTWVRDLPRLDPVSRQRTSVQRVEEVGAALLEWIQDVVSSVAGAPGAAAGELGTTVDMADYELVTVEHITDLLTGRLYYYTRCVPRYDAWGAPIEYRLNDSVLGFHVAAIRSFGADSVADGDFYEAGTFPADERDHDIVWADGYMVREPDASGTEIFLDGFESGELWGYWSCGPEF